MKQFVTLVLVLCLSMALGACASHYKDVEQKAQAPVNCATAESDLRVLENEKVHVAEQIAAGVRSIVPIGLVAGLVTETQGAK